MTLWERNLTEGYDANPAAPFVYDEWRQQNGVLEHLAAYAPVTLNLSDDNPERLQGTRASAALFDLLGTPALLGRTFSPEEESLGRDDVIVLSYALWMRRFGGDRQAIGQTLKLEGRARLIVGVMPRAFAFPGGTGTVLAGQPPSPADFWIPLALTPAELSQQANHWLLVLGRIRTGATIAQAQNEMNAVQDRIARNHPGVYVGTQVKLVTLRDQAIGNSRPALLVLMAAVALALLIACGNVANLLLARAVGRRRELAIRAALGAGRARLARRLITESVVLATVAGGVGVLLAAWGLDTILALAPATMIRVRDATIDVRVLAFALTTSIFTGLLFGTVPALEIRTVAETLRAGARGAIGTPSGRHVRHLVIVGELAFALVLLVSATLLIQSLYRLSHVPSGFESDHVLTFDLSLSRDHYPERLQRVVFMQQLTARLQTLSDITAVGAVTDLPLGGGNMNFAVRIDGRPDQIGGRSLSVDYRAVIPDYFQTLHIRLVRGRLLAATDATDSPPVVLVNEAFVRRFVGADDPIGLQTTLGVNNHRATIVGVVSDVKHTGLDVPPNEEMYGPYAQTPFWPFMTFVVRSTRDPTALITDVRRQVTMVDPQQPIAHVRPYADLVAESTGPARFRTALLALFTALAIALAVVGIYGVISYGVGQRTLEIGVRMALGAGHRDVLRLVVSDGVRLVAAGTLMGLVIAFATTRLLTALLFGISPTDPATFSVATVLVAATGLLACYVPAHRATAVDPVVALRHQ